MAVAAPETVAIYNALSMRQLMSVDAYADVALALDGHTLVFAEAVGRARVVDLPRREVVRKLRIFREATGTFGSQEIFYFKKGF